MDQQEIISIKTKSTSSVLFLTLRNIGIQSVSLIGFFLLTILLGPAEVGLFAIVAESISILGYFSDLGLAAALIQQSKKVDRQELQTSFFVQQVLVLISLSLVIYIYSRVQFQKSYGSKELWIFVSLCFSYLTASLKTIPSVLLERKLNFQLISTIDIVENLTFYILAVVFAYFGYGGYSYAIATFFRSLIGLVMIYHYQPWPIGVSFSLPTLKSLFRFGIPFQVNSLIAMAKDRLSNLVVAGIIGREGFGLLSWAQKGPRLPLSLMDAVMRVTFPTFSRLQHEPKLLSISLKKTVFYVSFFVFPIITGIALVAGDVINIIPKYSKWSQALFPLYLYAVNYAIAAITTPLTNAFNAVGQITTTTKFMVMWTVLTWVLYPPLSIHYGYSGTAIASLLVGLSSFVVWHQASKIFQLNIFFSVLHPLLSSLLIIITIVLINPPLLLKVFFGILIYSLYHYYFSRPEIIWLKNEIVCHFGKKSSLR